VFVPKYIILLKLIYDKILKINKPMHHTNANNFVRHFTQKNVFVKIAIINSNNLNL